MLIKTFSIKKFRSIIETEDLPINQLSILIGPNNKGKSNLLQGLVYFLQYLEERGLNRRRIISRRRIKSREHYSWDRDYPINLQGKELNGKSVFKIEFELKPREKYNIKQILGFELKGNLIVTLSVGKDNRTFSACSSINKRKKLDITKVREFIRKRISVQYIGAIRNAEKTLDVIEDMISTEMENLKEDKNYKKLLEQITKKEKPILDNLAKKLTKSISEFLPDIKGIELSTDSRIRNIWHSSDLIVDDGTKTSLELKGDGIKSLLAISVIQHVAKQNALKKNILLAIEEPESHLHPKAIHGFKKVLEDISTVNQIIITTHSPLLVNRGKVKSNLLIENSNVKVANSISEIRDLLGVNISDNLLNSNLVILFEGQDDVIIMKKWLSDKSSTIKLLIEDGQIVLDHLSGASNLKYKLSHWKSLLCDVFVFLDNDKAGNQALDEAIKRGLINEKDAFFCNVISMKESELEDLILIDSYKTEMEEKYNVELKGSKFKNNKKKWSDRLKDTFKDQGKRWSDNREAEIKLFIAETVSKKRDTIKTNCHASIDALNKSIENYFDKKNN